MNGSSTVSAELGLRLVVPQAGIVPLVASLYYSADDPYAIGIAFHVGLDEPVQWVFARDLLAVGLDRESGIGDVRVWPSIGAEIGHPSAVLNIELCSSFGEARFEAPVFEVSDFLRRTYEIVPPGRERDHADIEGELDELLRQAS